MEDQSITTIINTQETLVGDQIKRIKELVEGTPGLVIRPIKVEQDKYYESGIIIQPDTYNTWIVLIEPWRNLVVFKDSSSITLSGNFESAVITKIVKYYHE
jgi:hypothetical protein